MAKDQQNPDGTLEVVETPVDAVAASEVVVAKVATQGFDTFPNQFAEEIANARAISDARAAGAAAGAAAAQAAVAQQPGGVSHLREIARQEAAKAYQDAYDAAVKGGVTHVTPEEQQAIVKESVENPSDRPA